MSAEGPGIFSIICCRLFPDKCKNQKGSDCNDQKGCTNRHNCHNIALIILFIVFIPIFFPLLIGPFPYRRRTLCSPEFGRGYCFSGPALFIFGIPEISGPSALIRPGGPTDYGENTKQTGDEEAGNGTADGEAQQENDVSAEGTPDTEIQGDGSEPSTAGTLTIVSNVNVRDNPTTQGSNVIKVAKEGETYEYTGTAEDDNWYIIRLEDGSTGYIFKKYVSVD